MNKTLCSLALAAALCGATAAAQAATLELTGWKYGAGHSVAAATPVYNGQAGGFTGTLSAPEFSFDGPIDTYCVELGQVFHWNTSYDDFTILSASVVFGGSTASLLENLLSYALPQVDADVNQSKASTSLQLAIWNILTDGDASLATGAFQDGSAYAAKATSYLTAALTGEPVSAYDLYVLKSEKVQDQLFWVEQTRMTRRGGDVPEPSSFALAALALGGFGLSARRRKRAA